METKGIGCGPKVLAEKLARNLSEQRALRERLTMCAEECEELIELLAPHVPPDTQLDILVFAGGPGHLSILRDQDNPDWVLDVDLIPLKHIDQVAWLARIEPDDEPEDGITPTRHPSRRTTSTGA